MIKLRFTRKKAGDYHLLEMKHNDEVKHSDVLHIYDKDGSFIGIFDKPYGEKEMQLTLMEGAYALSGSSFCKMD